MPPKAKNKVPVTKRTTPPKGTPRLLNTPSATPALRNSARQPGKSEPEKPTRRVGRPVKQASKPQPTSIVGATAKARDRYNFRSNPQDERESRKENYSQSRIQKGAARTLVPAPDPEEIYVWIQGTTEDVPSEAPLVSEISSSSSNGLVALYRAYGREPPEDEMPSKKPESAAPSGASRKSKTVKPEHSAFIDALEERNIDLASQPDHKRNSIKRLILNRSLPNPSEDEEAHWEADMLKCDIAYEAIFHRTIMMDLIDRHRLDHILDYICEISWNCERMPRNMPEGALETCQPKSDLAVAFKRSSLINTPKFTKLQNLRTQMCPEVTTDEKGERRAFHFFSLEAKKPDAHKGESLASLQNLNTATQALYNIYVFMRRAQMEKEFFEDVRFYSIIATSQVFEVRVHRAVELDADVHIQHDYPLGFQHDVLLKIKSEHYKKAEVFYIMRNILTKYGVKILHPILKRAVEKVLRKLSSHHDTQPTTRTRMGKRQADGLLESFGSAQRRRLDALEVED